MTDFVPKMNKTVIYESLLTHEGCVVICDERILQIFEVQRTAHNAALEFGKQSVKNGGAAEVRLLKADGRLSRTKQFKPTIRKKSGPTRAVSHAPDLAERGEDRSADGSAELIIVARCGI